MHKNMIFAAMALASIGSVSTRAQEPAPSSSDEQIIRQSAQDYCAAFNQGDIDAVMGYWAPDADYVDENGETHLGAQAIGALFRESIDLKRHKLDLRVESLRFVKPDVAVEDGIALLTDLDGNTSEGPYTAVWVKSGDRWLINRARELPSDEESVSTDTAFSVQSLDWLVGEWVSEDDEQVVNLSSRWALDESFLVQDLSVDGPDESQIRVTQWIGVDPASGQIKSWTFDSRGGHGEALWNRDENGWRMEATGVLPDGRVGTAVNTLSFVDDSHFEWRSTDRNVDGQPMPDTEIRFVRLEQTENADVR